MWILKIIDLRLRLTKLIQPTQKAARLISGVSLSLLVFLSVLTAPSAALRVRPSMGELNF